MRINKDFLEKGKYADLGRWHVTRFVRKVAETLPAKSLVLDAGAGECVYKRFFKNHIYKSIDLGVGDSNWNYKNLDYVGPLHKMPIGDGVFDAVLCTQVLEHLEWPRESVKEMYRVLKPGGRLFLTVPMAQVEHQVPHDFFRYTSFGLRSICCHAGFKNIIITNFGGTCLRLAYESSGFLGLFPSVGIRSGTCSLLGVLLFPVKFIVWVSLFFIKPILCWLDAFEKHKNYPLGWACEATK